MGVSVFSVKEIVEDLLTKAPRLRDDDNALMLNVWYRQDNFLATRGTSFRYFAEQFKNGKLASSESIRRCRQKLQEEFPHLRGDKYLARHKHQEKIKEELRAPEIKAGGTP